MKSIIWVLAYDEEEASAWARENGLPEDEWRYTRDPEHLKLAIKGDRFHFVGSHVRERADFIPLAGIVRAKKMDWWRS